VSWKYRKDGGEMRQNWVEKERKTGKDGKEVIVWEANLILHTEMSASLPEEEREKWMMRLTESVLLDEAIRAYKQNGNLHNFVQNAGAIIQHAGAII
jgi:hypothetical protein